MRIQTDDTRFFNSSANFEHVSSEGARNQKRRETMIYYKLPLQTILKKMPFASHRKAYFMQFG